MDDKKPKLNATGQKELEKVEAQFDAQETQMKSYKIDPYNLPPREESEPQVKISNRQALAVKENYLKPTHVHSSRERFNEKYRADYEYAKVYVPFIAEHNEMKGEVIEIWTKSFPGMPAEEWHVPTNTPVWGPRYLAEQIKRKCYSRLAMKENMSSGQDAAGKYYGQIVAETSIPRLDARPVNQSKSIFMGADGT